MDYKELESYLHGGANLFRGSKSLLKPLLIAAFCMTVAAPAVADESKASAAPASVEQVGKKVTGTIVDKTGEPVMGATVTQKGKGVGAVSDADGHFTLNVTGNNPVISISYIGYKTQEIAVGNRSNLAVTLEDDSEMLDEVVAIGYGYVKKKDLTGSVASVSADQLNLGGTVSNAAQALQGKAAGVQVQQTSKAPGGSISVRVRGNNSISSTNEPLYVVDGFPTTQGLDINPNDIESMQILKDASATAIYGARGANGVVLITTKRGMAGQNKISYSGYVGFQKMQNPFDFINAKDYMNLQNDLFREIDGQEGNQYGAYTPSQLESNVDTDWLDVCTRTGLVTDHNVQFAGGNDKTKVMTSIGYFKQEGILKNTDFNRISGRVNVDQVINQYIKAGASVYAHRETSNYQFYSGNILNSNVVYSMMLYDPTVVPYNEDGTYGRVPGGRGDNPLANLMERVNDMTNDKLDGTVFVDIMPITGLTVHVSGSAELLHNYQGTYLPNSTYQGSIEGGVASNYDFRGTRTVFESTANYLTTINKIHDIGVMLGYTYEKYESNYRSQQGKKFSTDAYQYNNMGAAGVKTSMTSYKGENMLASFFGRVNYTLMNKYLFTATIRRDGSSHFPKDNRWGTFPSFSLAWRASEEDFIKNLNVFSNLKFRVGYGVTGNERISDYAYLAKMSSTHLTFDGSTNVAGTHINTGSAANDKLKWETTKQFNAGVDMGFLNNRITATIDFYYKKTDDLLMNLTMPRYTGFTSGQQNIGAISNTGVELELNTINFDGEFKWNTRFNVAYNKNKVLKIGQDNDIYITSAKPMGTVSEESYAIIREGEPLGSLFGYKYIGVLQQGETYAPQPNAVPGDPKFEDVNGDGVIDSNDRTILGHANPDVIFGLTNNFAYKNFDLSIFFQGSLGNKMLNMTNMNLEWKRTTDALNRWTPSNTNTNIPRNGFYYSKYGGYINDHFIEDASYCRLKNITLGYTIPFKKVISSCRVYFSAENLFTITGYSGFDPEIDTKGYEVQKNGGGQQTANAGAGLDFNSYPSMRTYTFGVNVTF